MIIWNSSLSVVLFPFSFMILFTRIFSLALLVWIRCFCFAVFFHKSTFYFILCYFDDYLHCYFFYFIDFCTECDYFLLSTLLGCDAPLCSITFRYAVKLLVEYLFRFFLLFRHLVVWTYPLELLLLCPRTLDTLCIYFHSI